MANPQTENGYIRIANEIWDEVIRRDFSKRQKDILLFIWRLSYGCQQRAAYIPKMKDFELSGVPATQIKSELEFLEKSRVLLWDRDEKLFEINKDYEKWYVSLVKSWNDERFAELLAVNIRHKKTSQNMKESFMKHEDQNGENFTKHEDCEEQNFMKHEEGTSQNMNIDFMKREVGSDLNPCGSKSEDTSKDIIKDSIKNSSGSSNKVLPFVRGTDPAGCRNPDFSFTRIYQIYEKHFTSDGRVTEFEVEDLNHAFDDYGGEWVFEAMREAARHRKFTLAYVNGILRGYSERGGPGNKDSPPVTEPQVAELDENDPITQRLLKESARQLEQRSIV